MENGGRKISDPKSTLAECREAIGELRNSIRELLGDVAATTLQPDQTKKLEAWNTITLVRDRERKVHDIMNRAVQALFEIPFGTWEDANFRSSLKTEIREYQHLKWKYEFLMLQSQIEHSEQTIPQLWEVLRGLRAELVMEESNWTPNPGVIVLRKRVEMQGDRLHYELRNILRMIKTVIGHEHFSDLPRNKQQMYHAKWKTCNDRLSEVLNQKRDQ